MNISVSAPAAGLPVTSPISLPLDDTDEAIIRLTKAYRAGVDAYNAMDIEDLDGVVADDCYGNVYRQLITETPTIRTAAGAISALEVAIADEGVCWIGNINTSAKLTGAVIDFLKGTSAVGGSVITPFPLAAGDDAMVALVREYRVRDAAYCYAPLGISQAEENRLGDESNVPFFKLRDETPRVTSLAGVIAAIELVYDDATKNLDTEEDIIGAGFTPSVLKASLEYLKAAASAALAHPDAELLTLRSRMDNLEAQMVRNSDAYNALLPEANRRYETVPKSLIVTEQDVHWFSSALKGKLSGDRWAIQGAIDLAMPQYGVITGTLKQARARAEKLRQAGASHLASYEKWQVESGIVANEEKYCALAEEWSDKAQRALAIRPTTLAGAVAQAKIVKWENYSLFNTDPGEFDTGEKETVDFINNLLPMGS